jgi:hypothetical protein
MLLIHDQNVTTWTPLASWHATHGKEVFPSVFSHQMMVDAKPVGEYKKTADPQ